MFPLSRTIKDIWINYYNLLQIYIIISQLRIFLCKTYAALDSYDILSDGDLLLLESLNCWPII